MRVKLLIYKGSEFRILSDKDDAAKAPYTRATVILKIPVILSLLGCEVSDTRFTGIYDTEKIIEVSGVFISATHK